MTDKTAYQLLDADQKRAMDECLDALVKGLQDYAHMMDKGEIPMCSGPDALRDFAATILVVRIQQEEPTL